jgi:hypothetical protein
MLAMTITSDREQELREQAREQAAEYRRQTIEAVNGRYSRGSTEVQPPFLRLRRRTDYNSVLDQDTRRRGYDPRTGKKL